MWTLAFTRAFSLIPVTALSEKMLPVPFSWVNSRKAHLDLEMYQIALAGKLLTSWESQTETNDHGYVPLVVNTPRSFLGTAYPSGAPQFTPGCQWGSCYSIFSFMCIFWRSMFVILSFFFWPLCCHSVLYLRILITPLVSLSSSNTVTLSRKWC